jgi:hypothetical protein
MANEATIFIPQFEDALFQAFDPIRIFAKEDSVAPGAKTVSIPVSGGLTFANVTANNTTYPVNATERTDTAGGYDLTNIQVNPIRIGNWDEFVQNANLRQSIFNEVAGVLGAYASRIILKGFHTTGTTATTPVYAPTGTTTYTNRHGKASVKALSISDLLALGKKMDLQGVPRDGQRYLILDPEMFTGFMLGLAAIGYEDTATQAFSTGVLQNIAGFNVMMMNEVAVAAASNASCKAPGAAVEATDLNVGYALHKNFVGFAASGVNLFLQEQAPEYYGAVISGDFYAGGKYRRATGIGCITIYETA